MATKKLDHWQLKAYLDLRVVLQPTMHWVLQRRLKRGKEETERPYCNLKPAAQPLAVDEDALKTFQAALADRTVWVAASTHTSNEDVVLRAQTLVVARDPRDTLIRLARDLMDMLGSRI